MNRNRGKEVWVILDNCRPHRSIAPEYESKYQGKLHFMFQPPYSPELNPQENVWAWLKDCCARGSGYAADKELSQRIRKFFIYASNTPCGIRRRVDARVYLGGGMISLWSWLPISLGLHPPASSDALSSAFPRPRF